MEAVLKSEVKKYVCESLNANGWTKKASVY